MKRIRPPLSVQIPKQIPNSTSNLKQNLVPSSIIPTRSFLLIFLLLSTTIFGPFGYFMITRFGFGDYFPMQEFSEMAPLLPESCLNIVAELPIPPGNIAVSSKNRMFFNFHPEYNPNPIKIAELINKTHWKPFPSLEFQLTIITILSLRIDKLDRLWLLDFANHGLISKPKLFAFDLKANKDTLVKSYTFPSEVAGFGSMLNDFQVDPSGNFVFVVDTSIIGMKPALIVYSVLHDTSYRIISNHPSLFGQSMFLNISGTDLRLGPLGVRIHADSIALDRTGSNLYFGAVTSNKLYSVSTSYLLYYVHKAREDSRSFKLDVLDRNVAQNIIEVCDAKPATDGISTDAAGNIWMTAIEHSAIAIGIPISTTVEVSNQKSIIIRKVVQSTSLLRWPDGFSFGPDGLYITNSALHYKFSGKFRNISDGGPYHILKISTKHLNQITKGYFKKSFKFELPFSGH